MSRFEALREEDSRKEQAREDAKAKAKSMLGKD